MSDGLVPTMPAQNKPKTKFARHDVVIHFPEMTVSLIVHISRETGICSHTFQDIIAQKQYEAHLNHQVQIIEHAASDSDAFRCI